MDNDDLLAEAGESEGDGSNAEEDIVGKKMTNHSPWYVVGQLWPRSRSELNLIFHRLDNGYRRRPVFARVSERLSSTRRSKHR